MWNGFQSGRTLQVGIGSENLRTKITGGKFFLPVGKSVLDTHIYVSNPCLRGRQTQLRLSCIHSFTMHTMVLILDGNSLSSAHVQMTVWGVG